MSASTLPPIFKSPWRGWLWRFFCKLFVGPQMSPVSHLQLSVGSLGFTYTNSTGQCPEQSTFCVRCSGHGVVSCVDTMYWLESSLHIFFTPSQSWFDRWLAHLCHQQSACLYADFIPFLYQAERQWTGNLDHSIRSWTVLLCHSNSPCIVVGYGWRLNGNVVLVWCDWKQN